MTREAAHRLEALHSIHHLLALQLELRRHLRQVTGLGGQVTGSRLISLGSAESPP